MKKKLIPLFLACALILTGCGETSLTSTDNSSSTTNSNTSVNSAESDSTNENSATETSESASTSETSKQPNEIAQGVVTNGQVVAKIGDHFWGISLYGGGTGDNYASYVNQFKEKVGANVNVFNMVAPTASAFYLPSNYDEYNASQLDSINSIANQLSSVINIDGYGALEAHKDEYIYTRTDHHWMPLGAYYAAQAFAKTAGVDFSDISTYEKVDVEGYVGSLYSFTQSADLLNDPEVFSYYVPATDYTATYYTTDFQIDEDVKFYHTIFVDQPASSAYSTFMGGDQKIVKIETETKNGRKLVVFKDSYGNAEIPFLIGSFEEIYVCDVRYFDINAIDFVKEQGITDVLFTMCTFSAVGENAEGINTIINK